MGKRRARKAPANMITFDEARARKAPGQDGWDPVAGWGYER